MTRPTGSHDRAVRSVEVSDRLPRRHDPIRVPQPIEGSEGLFVVDATWGQIRPIELADEVRTVGELEVIDHLQKGLPLVDTRLHDVYVASTIPGARNIPHAEILERRGELSHDVETVFFCNGPQCAATPDAVGSLLGAGYPPTAILYYRGGMHDWVTLGLPVAVRG